MNNSTKKTFVEPELFVHGQIEEITEQNNKINSLDLPQGTPVNPNNGLNGIIGS